VDVVFLDPPYQKGLVPLALESAQRQGWVDLDTVVVVEHALTETIAPPQGWEVAVHRRYGRSGVTVLCAVHDGAKDDEHDDAATED
jgi:16S rRNA (guanine966-N2)-methyltransferase